ncbi:putative amino acid racemase [Marinitoga piezophila KA3]|uniref:Putative amino acid racemase n=1 Tax=Marinitoga piezophila (strain DSM 14283 / JCM 11233 / KA3) TaxID=443254 RepID=H2J3F4_MARPK|nr:MULTISPECIES: alanine/ornithine racemase family PLP-dependent enzyme [Marinitoga]AEX85770.1 putative amino acid racemase [Marinitoga piezophila KA3]APT76213.1 alanine racemase [Marinitoga sp. 1137]
MYPVVHIYPEKIKENALNIKKIFEERGISFTAVTKVTAGNIDVANALIEAGVKSIGDSRIQNIIDMKNAGIDAEYMLLRIPMKDEIELLVKYVDVTLVSEIETVKWINDAAEKTGKIQDIIYMVDVGDLREGVWYENAVEEISKVKDFKNIKLKGIGTNLGCFGGVLPSKENMTTLLNIKKEIEEKLNIKIEIVSGGNTAALPLVEKNLLPEGINHFRLGESIICGTDVTNNRIVPGNNVDTMILEAQIIELKDKPSVPVGEIGFDAFGRKPEFEDKGIRKKAILAIGEQDIIADGLIPLDEKLEVLHASSDHTIVDVTDSEKEYKLGDTIKFRMSYGCLLKVMTGKYVEKIIHK